MTEIEVIWHQDSGLYEVLRRGRHLGFVDSPALVVAMIVRRWVGDSVGND